MDLGILMDGSPCAPPFHEEGAPDALGCVLKQSGTPLSPLALCFFLTGLTQGPAKHSLGAVKQSPGSVCSSLLLLGCQ